MNRLLYAIQGVFFQQTWRLGTAIDPEIGIRATIGAQLEFTMFHALLGKDEGDEHFSGTMNDRYGTAAITNFVLTDIKMSFSKKYLQRNDVINYEFTEQKDGIWYGTYSGGAVGTGTAKCLVNAVDESFVSPVKELEEAKTN